MNPSEDLKDDLFDSILRIEENISRRKTPDSHHARLSNLITNSSDFQQQREDEIITSSRDPYSELHHEYEEETLVRADRRERNNVFQAFLEKREKKNQLHSSSPPSPRFKNYKKESSTMPSSNMLESDARLFTSVVNKPSTTTKAEDSFIAESENFLEEISNLQRMTLDPKTVDKRKQTVTKLSDFKRKQPLHNNNNVEENPHNGLPLSSTTRTSSFNLRPTLDHHFESLIPKEFLEDNHQDLDDMSSFKKQLEERIKLRNESHRLGLKREDPNRPTLTKNVMKPDDLRKLITSVKKKGQTKETSSRAFCLAGLLDVEQGQNVYNTTTTTTGAGVKKHQTSADFTLSSSSINNKKFSKSMLQTNKSSSVDNSRPSSAKKVRFNPSGQTTENRSKSNSKKDSDHNQILLKKNLGLISDSVYSSSATSTNNKKPPNLSTMAVSSTTTTKKTPVQSLSSSSSTSSSSSFRDLLAQRKGVSLPKDKPTTGAPEKINSSSIATPRVGGPTLNNSKSIQKSQQPKTNMAMEKTPRMNHLTSSDRPTTKPQQDARNTILREKPTHPHYQFSEEGGDSEEDDDFLEARRLMQRISMLRNFIGGDSKINK